MTHSGGGEWGPCRTVRDDDGAMEGTAKSPTNGGGSIPSGRWHGGEGGWRLLWGGCRWSDTRWHQKAAGHRPRSNCGWQPLGDHGRGLAA